MYVLRVVLRLAQRSRSHCIVELDLIVKVEDAVEREALHELCFSSSTSIGASLPTDDGIAECYDSSLI